MPSPSTAEELFDRQDDGFVAAVRAVGDPARLAALADGWKLDPRPWARRQVLEYLRLPLDSPGHEPLVKRLFKQAEGAGDDEVMAAFLFAFDRLVRRIRKQRWRYDPETGSSWREEILKSPHNTLRKGTIRVQFFRNPRTGASISGESSSGNRGRLFTYHTRYYLRRRAWRYFRKLGFQRPADYVTAICRGLALYEDADLDRGEHLLECWGLMHACFGGHKNLAFSATRVSVRSGQTLSDLSPAPLFAALWRETGALPSLLKLVGEARCNLVRRWAITLTRQEHAAGLTDLPIATLAALLRHEQSEVRLFAAELFARSQRLAALPLDEWLSLLDLPDPLVLAAVCDALRRHVSGERLMLDQCVQLACAQASPVARLGLDLLRDRAVESAADRGSLVRLADAKCPALAGELAFFALGVLGSTEHYDRDAVTRFFDSPLAEARAAAWNWLGPESPGYGDPVLWSRLFETPYDDVRLRMVEALDHRTRVGSPGFSRSSDRLNPEPPTDLTHLWCSVLLGVHRGGRQKQRAIAQIGREIERLPERVESSLPVLAVALRSIRAPERRAALAALITAIERRPELLPAARRFVPELVIHPLEA